jgi:hypoxanthine phosphoribosyltransferase
VVQQCLKYSQNLIEAIPTAGVGQWITFIRGAGSVIVIDIRNVIDAGKSLETLHEYLEKSKKKSLPNAHSSVVAFLVAYGFQRAQSPSLLVFHPKGKRTLTSLRRYRTSLSHASI